MRGPVRGLVVAACSLLICAPITAAEEPAPVPAAPAPVVADPVATPAPVDNTAPTASGTDISGLTSKQDGDIPQYTPDGPTVIIMDGGGTYSPPTRISDASFNQTLVGLGGDPGKLVAALATPKQIGSLTVDQLGGMIGQLNDLTTSLNTNRPAIDRVLEVLASAGRAHPGAPSQCVTVCQPRWVNVQSAARELNWQAMLLRGDLNTLSAVRDPSSVDAGDSYSARRLLRSGAASADVVAIGVDRVAASVPEFKAALDAYGIAYDALDKGGCKSFHGCSTTQH